MRQLNIASLIGKKRCIWCHLEKNVSEFYRWVRSPDGYRNYCKQCGIKRGWSRGRHHYERENIKEAEDRRELTDRIVKRIIYILEHYTKRNKEFTYADITREMIDATRRRILEKRSRAIVQKHKADPHIRTCDICRKPYMASGRTNESPFCSDECRNRDSFIKYYSNRDTILRSVREKHRRDRHISVSRKCKQCGGEFTLDDRLGAKVYCSRKCMKVALKSNARRRARRFNVKYESIRPMDIFTRDGFRCQICGKETPRNRRGTRYPNAPELDHRVPISKGGSHTRDNLQCACRACNGKKLNKNNIGQLPLFSHIDINNKHNGNNDLRA